MLAAFFIQMLTGDIAEGEILWRVLLAVPLIVNVGLNWFFPLNSRVSLSNKQVERIVVVGGLFIAFLVILLFPVGFLVVIVAMYGLTAWRIGVLLTRHPTREEGLQ